MKTLETQRLILRGFTEDDVDDAYEYCIDPEVGPAAGWAPHKNKAETMTIIRSFIEKQEVWAVVEKETDKVIGSLGLHLDTKRTSSDVKMIGYVLASPSWGKGYASEMVRRVLAYAFEELHLGMVSVYHYTFNERSKRVIEKAGFTFEGILRKAAKLPDGRITDDVCYSMTEHEYRILREKNK